MTDYFYNKIQENYQEPKTKDNHIIPQLILRKFSQKKIYQSIYVNLLTNEKKHPVLKNKKKSKITFPEMFSLNRFFNDELEEHFGNIENKTSPLIERFTKYASNNLDFNQFSTLNKHVTINSNVISINHFNFTNDELVILSDFYSGILFRLTMSYNIEPIDEKYLTSFCSDFYDKVTEEFHVNDKNLLTQQLEKFKKTILKVNKNKITRDINDFCYHESYSRIIINDFIHTCLVNEHASLITWNAPIITISNTIPFSWDNKVLIIPISCNSVLYLESSILFSINDIQKNTDQILKEYINYIHINGSEFLFFDQSIVNKIFKNNTFQYPKK